MCVRAYAQAFSTNSLHKENILKNTFFDQKVLQEELCTSVSSCISLWSVEVLVTQSCPTLCDPMDCNLPGSSVHGILQARTLEWVAIPFSRGSFQPKDWTQVSCIAGRFFTIWAREAQYEVWEGQIGLWTELSQHC